MDQFLIGLLFYFILLRHAPAVSLLIIDGMFVNAENVRRPRTSTRRRFGSHLDFLHHLHETWKSQRPQKIPLCKGNFGVSFDVLSVQTGHEIVISLVRACVRASVQSSPVQSSPVHHKPQVLEESEAGDITSHSWHNRIHRSLTVYESFHVGSTHRIQLTVALEVVAHRK